MKISTKDLTLCGLFAAITCVLAQISIQLPFSPVPFTLQVMAVYLAGVILGGKRGFISQLVYVALGAIGVPVFANFTGGASIILGPTGGFVIAFPFMALIAGYSTNKYKSKIYIVIAMIIALLFCYIFGAVWLSVIGKMSFTSALKVAVLPFILFDAVKIVIVAIIGLNVRTRIVVGGLS
ncbi:biotin transporter BioY [Clostridium oryzae]|uniref:Biotin transporter n=1 Tax=Clostridium oryzae TaxID=1450648 RepID=A0A1V4IWJ6_9CLOT|nr:biotin transporter BioY [Clostridium oryzae]OPJ64432.1 biotin transporter BioY [Clostridium oryzae]